MDTSTWASVLGGLATVVFGVWAVLLAVRKKYPGEIVFLDQDTISLFESITKNLPSLKITYNDEPVSKYLVLLKGFIVNTGNLDISEGLTEENLSMNLPSEFKWVDSKVVDTSPKLSVELRIKHPNILEFDFGLFRCREYVQFEALAEVPASTEPESGKTSPSERLLNEMEFTHRIPNTDKVKRLEYRPVETLAKRRNKVIILSWLVCIFISVPNLIDLYYNSKPENNPLADIQYDYPFDGEIRKVKIYPRPDGKLLVKTENDIHQKMVNPNDFFLNNTLKPNVVPKMINIFGLYTIRAKTVDEVNSIVAYSSLTFFLGVTIFVTFHVYLKTRKLRLIAGCIKTTEIT